MSFCAPDQIIRRPVVIEIDFDMADDTRQLEQHNLRRSNAKAESEVVESWLLFEGDLRKGLLVQLRLLIIDLIEQYQQDGTSLLTSQSTFIKTETALAATVVNGTKTVSLPVCSKGIHNPKTKHPETKAEQPSLDSGASLHMIADFSSFSTYKECTTSVETANGEMVPVLKDGLVTAGTTHGDITLHCLHIPSLQGSLIIFGTVFLNGCNVKWTGGSSLTITKNNKLLMNGVIGDSVITLDIELPNNVSKQNLSACKVTTADGVKLYQPLGHANTSPQTPQSYNQQFHSITSRSTTFQEWGAISSSTTNHALEEEHTSHTTTETASALPKTSRRPGFDMVLQPVNSKAPKDISSTIDSSNILHDSRRQTLLARQTFKHPDQETSRENSLTRELEALKEKALNLEGLVNRVFQKEKELTPAKGQKENMTSGQDRYRQDCTLDEEAPEEIRSEPIATPEQGRRFFSRGTGRTRNEKPPDIYSGSRAIGRPPSGIPRYTGSYHHQQRTNPFSQQSVRYNFTNNSQTRPTYQSPLDEANQEEPRLQTPGNKRGTRATPERRNLTKIKPVSLRVSTA
ncbi:hypothetical protein BY996DRAFT_6473838 [Phakopsora pachyrhizi]|nr:hypothetical protein BY996DRAFT_6473838 [Phakopsora pachyrhizi]